MITILFRSVGACNARWMATGGKPEDRPILFTQRTAAQVEASLKALEYVPVADLSAPTAETEDLSTELLESVWVSAQNLDSGCWCQARKVRIGGGEMLILPHGTEPVRSMSVDDLVYHHETGRFYYCSSLGWTPLDTMREWSAR